MPDLRLLRHGTLLGTLTRTGGDMPWWTGDFEPTPAFEVLRPQFQRELAQLEADDVDGWGETWEQLSAGLVLEPVDGSAPITEFLLHVEGAEAWWRY